MGPALLLLLAAAGDYSEVKSDLAALRVQSRAAYAQAPTAAKKTAALATARSALLTAFDTQLFPAWAGTTWEFYGTSETPRDGAIACGYYVSTLLRDAGFKVERVKLAQQASEYIVRSLAEPEQTVRSRDGDVKALLARLRATHGEGLYVVGMDFHVAFLRIDSKGEQLCHSAVFTPTAVLCEDAATSLGFVSKYHVAGKLFGDAQLRGWLEGASIPMKN